MSATLAPAAPAPAVFVDPLAIDDAPARVEAAVAAMVEAVVGTVEQSLAAAARRRAVTFAVREVRRLKQELDEQVPVLGPAAGLLVDGTKASLMKLYATLNPAAEADQVETAAEAAVAGYRPAAEAKKRGKSSAG